MRAFLEKIAPLNHADEITKPLFVIQGQNDPRVPRSESEQMVHTVRKNDTPWSGISWRETRGTASLGRRTRTFSFAPPVLFVKGYLLPRRFSGREIQGKDS
jgi:hypothetical protein